MIILILYTVFPTIVFGLNNITTNAESDKLVISNNTSGAPNTTVLHTTTTTSQVPQNITTISISTNTTITMERQTKPLPLRNGTGEVMERVPLETQKKSDNSMMKKKTSGAIQPRAKKNTAKVVKPHVTIKRYMQDMPDLSDLDEIMDTLHKMINFFLENKNDVDISLYFGLFIMDVNLNKVFKTKQHSIPPAIAFNLKHLLEKNDHLLLFFRKMVASDSNADDEMGKNLASLFSNERVWMSRLPLYDGAHMNDTPIIDYEVLLNRYGNWDKYLTNIRDYDQAIPRPDQSDRCLGFLAKNPFSEAPWQKQCKIPAGCRIPLQRGSNFGYGLTHRLMYLQLAYYGHRCYVFSSTRDKELREKFCKSLYSEASFISQNEYVAIDLFVEQLCLCAMDGHYEFLRRSWLMGILSFQTMAGCFSDSMPNGAKQPRGIEPNPWLIDRGQNQYILNDQCNIHTSSAAAATLSFAIKFLLETYY